MMRRFKTLFRNKHRRATFAKQTSGTQVERDLPSSSSVDWLKVSLTLFTIVALSILMSVHLMPDRVTLQLGETSPTELKASRGVFYVNTTATQRLQRAAALGTRPVYDVDESAVAGAQRVVRDYFDLLEQERTHIAAAPARTKAIQEAYRTLEPQLGSVFSPAQLKYLLPLPIADFQQLRDTTTRLIGEAMDREIRDQSGEARPSRDRDRAIQDILTNARAALSSKKDIAIIEACAKRALRPNRLLNLRKTELESEKNTRAVPPVSEAIARGDRVIAAGERVTQDHLDKFTALGLRNPHLDIKTGIAICILAATMVLLVVYYIARSLPKLYADRKRLSLLSVIVLLSVFGLKVGASTLGLSFSSGQLGFLGMMSVAAAGMLVSVLLDMHLALLVVALLSVQSGLIMNHEIRYTIMTLMSSLVGIVSVGSVRSKTHLYRTTIALSVTNLTLVWLMGLLLRDSLPELLTGSVWAIGSAVFATFLFWFGVLALEKPFGILTHTALLEMSAFDQPLLKQLCAVAPGTYAHSMMVGTLAEAGAQAIGADALLCRVGGYYHDIGKMRRPDFFVENQRRENVHGRLSPSLSALFITAHVRDGLEMAQEQKLPTEIQDMVAQHHGTTLIRYFYHRALTDCGEGADVPPGLEERFRYPGPKPQTRETAIVMLADSVEAAARCLDKPTEEQVAKLIASIVRDKIEDGQFDESPLTFQDIKGISNAFLHFLTAMMHQRIDYPELEPRTATGKPMEVSRPDLRPEPIQHALPLLLTDITTTADVFDYSEESHLLPNERTRLERSRRTTSEWPENNLSDSGEHQVSAMEMETINLMS